MIQFIVLALGLTGCGSFSEPSSDYGTCTYSGYCERTDRGSVFECVSGDVTTYVALSTSGAEEYSTENRSEMEEFCCGEDYSFCEGSSGGGGGGSDTGAGG